jgi:lipopolysaccharide heptosyltransferase II
MKHPSWLQARRILCVRLDYLGDVLMTTPAIRALKQSLPDCHVTLLTSGSGVAVSRYIPEIDDTIRYDAPWLKSGGEHAPALDLAMIRQLEQGRFDAAVIFTVYSQNPLPSAMLCYLAGIPLRLAHCRENPYRLLTDWVPDPEPEKQVRHEVRRQLDLVATVGARPSHERLSFRIPAADRDAVQERLRALGIDAARPWIVLHPGASAPSRRYPPEQWIAAAEEIGARLGCPLLFTGGKDEVALVEQIRRAAPQAHTLAGELGLGELAALIAQAPLLVSGNTGPAHIAAAVGTPVVDLYALTNPQHTPWQVQSRVLFEDVPCRNCYKSVCPKGHHRCLAGIAPARVADAVCELLQRTAPSSLQEREARETFALPLT